MPLLVISGTPRAICSWSSRRCRAAVIRQCIQHCQTLANCTIASVMADRATACWRLVARTQSLSRSFRLLRSAEQGPRAGSWQPRGTAPQYRSDLCVESLTLALDEALISGILHQCVLETVGRIRRRATAVYQLRRNHSANARSRSDPGNSVTAARS